MSEESYLRLLEKIKNDGDISSDRTGTGTKSIFGEQLRFNLDKGLPLLNSKRIHWKSVLIELLWIMKGDTNIQFLKKHNVRIWNEWADKNGDLGAIYGKQWRNWSKGAIHGIDQLSMVINSIKTNPNSRRHIVNAWNVSEIDQMALPPCHMMFQFYVSNNKLSCQLYQRSADMFLGVPFNIASYSTLTFLIANECGLDVGEFIHTFGDAHIYNNHLDAVNEQLSRKNYNKELPSLNLNIKPGNLIDFIDNKLYNYSWEKIEQHIKLLDYNPESSIKAKVSI